MIIPNPFRFIGSFGRVLMAYICGNTVFVPQDTERIRRAICETCSDFDDVMRQCQVCSCFIDLKCPLATEQCPRKKWLKWRRRLDVSSRIGTDIEDA